MAKKKPAENASDRTGDAVPEKQASDEASAGEIKAGRKTYMLMDIVRVCDLAAKGDPRAEYEIGRRYEIGLDIDQDFANAERWYAKASVHGNADASFALVELYAFEYVVPGNRDVVEDLILTACSQYKRDYEAGIDKGYSAFQIYELMYNGYYLKKPLVTAADDWLKKAMAENYSEAFGEYARRFMLGEHARQDFRKAYHYYKLAYDYYDMSWVMKDSIGGFTAIPQLECCIKKRIFDCFGFLNW